MRPSYVASSVSRSQAPGLGHQPDSNCPGTLTHMLSSSQDDVSTRYLPLTVLYFTYRNSLIGLRGLVVSVYSEKIARIEVGNSMRRMSNHALSAPAALYSSRAGMPVQESGQCPSMATSSFQKLTIRSASVIPTQSFKLACPGDVVAFWAKSLICLTRSLRRLTVRPDSGCPSEQ